MEDLGSMMVAVEFPLPLDEDPPSNLVLAPSLPPRPPIPEHPAFSRPSKVIDAQQLAQEIKTALGKKDVVAVMSEGEIMRVQGIDEEDRAKVDQLIIAHVPEPRLSATEKRLQGFELRLQALERGQRPSE